jgi:hypothetical protein
MRVYVETSSYSAMQQLLQLHTLNVTGATTAWGKEGTSLYMLKQDFEPSIADSLLIYFFIGPHKYRILFL